jgi:acyl-CoA reductase-like NAD-dependent aldehyde dehydrogenase
VPSPPLFLGALSRIYPEPLGVALIMAPWNYPMVLLLAPLVGAMAAGNCAVLKPSELSDHASAVIASMFAERFDPAYVAVVEGAMEVNEPLMRERFDYIFFTGGAVVGRVVMKAAAEHLTPVTLELGGKSPCIVERSARLGYAARRIAARSSRAWWRASSAPSARFTAANPTPVIIMPASSTNIIFSGWSGCWGRERSSWEGRPMHPISISPRP